MDIEQKNKLIEGLKELKNLEVEGKTVFDKVEYDIQSKMIRLEFNNAMKEVSDLSKFGASDKQ